MLGSINPLGERGRGSRWTVTISWYVAGATLAGATLGGVLASIGTAVTSAVDLSADAAVAFLAVVICAAVAADLGLLGSVASRPRRQVNDDWLCRYRGWVYGLGFGFQLGLGFATVVSTGALYATFAAAFL